MNTAILVYPGCSLWSAIGSMELLLKANRLNLLIHGGESANNEFKPLFVAAEEVVKTSYKYPVAYHARANTSDVFDLILVPAFDMDPLSILKENKNSVAWIKMQYEKGAEIVSFCTGAFLLGASGILNGKNATTHWLRAKQFEEFFPEVQLTSEKLIVENNRISLSGGSTSFQNMVLHIVEKNMGRQVALSLAKIYLIDINRSNQLEYSSLTAQKDHQDKKILKAQQIIEKNNTQKLPLDEIAEKVAMSMRTFMRRFKKATGDTPLHYIQRVKVEIAKTKLESESTPFEEIVYEVGYEDINAFRKVFKKFTGTSPTDYRRKFNPEYAV